MTDRRCPDCAVTMEGATVRSQGRRSLVIDDGTRDGLLGKLRISETTAIDAVRCPECGLVRLYADLE